MKTQFITLAALLLFSLGVSAKENTNVNTDEITVSEMSHSNYQAEESLDIESWMSDDNFWNFDKVNKAATNVLSVEQPLQLAEWMTNNDLWKHNTKELSKFNTVDEEPLTIESWMTNDDSWSM